MNSFRGSQGSLRSEPSEDQLGEVFAPFLLAAICARTRSDIVPATVTASEKLIFGTSKLITPIPYFIIIISIYYPRTNAIAPLREVSHFGFFPRTFAGSRLTRGDGVGSHLPGREGELQSARDVGYSSSFNRRALWRKPQVVR